MRKITLLISLLLPPQALGFKPAPPPASWTVTDAAKQVTLTVETANWKIRAITLRHNNGQPKRWPKIEQIPTTIRISARHRRVVFLGGYGDGCNALGRIAVYDFDGKLRGKLDLRKRIPDLASVSRSFTRICCPCRWVAAAQLIEPRGELSIDVCNRYHVRLRLTGKPQIIALGTRAPHDNAR
ncbi:MAG: hypothetical protein H6707_15375 [Deltaproteobacteria bacterium]|nr:hypothetical protein [Deltaproteobacteria bacterium]